MAACQQRPGETVVVRLVAHQSRGQVFCTRVIPFPGDVQTQEQPDEHEGAQGKDNGGPEGTIHDDTEKDTVPIIQHLGGGPKARRRDYAPETFPWHAECCLASLGGLAS